MESIGINERSYTPESITKKAKELAIKFDSDNIEIRDIGNDIQKAISSDIDSLSELCKEDRSCDTAKVLEELNYTSKAISKDRKLLSSNKLTRGIRKFIGSYKSSSQHIKEICELMESMRDELISRIDQLDLLGCTMNKEYTELEPIVEALKLKVEEIKESMKHMDTDELDYGKTSRVLQSYQKRLEDLETTRVVAYQTMRNVGAVIITNQALASQMDYAIANVVPLWKSQLILASNNKLQDESLKLTESVSKVANDLIMQNAKDLANNTKRIHDIANKPIIDVETLQKADSVIKKLISDISPEIEKSNTQHTKVMESLAELQDKIGHVKQNKLGSSL